MSDAHDYLLKLDLAEIGTLVENAYERQGIPPFNDTYTFCFWFYCSENTGTKIIASSGNKTINHRGWTVYLQDSSLNFRVKFDDQSQQLSTTITSFSSWQHFTGIINKTSRQIKAYLNGSGDWKNQQPGELVEAGSVDESENLIIGGYTDLAGGHFNYRFGESADELVDDFRFYARALSDREITSFLVSSATPPIANFKVQQNAHNRIVKLDADLSQGENLIYLWDLGDSSSALGKEISHRYAYSANFEITLRVVDRYHQQSICKKTRALKGETRLPDKIPVFVNGAEGYACFRIPAIIKAINGDLVAFAEGRVAGCSDATQVIHIVAKRSLDNGLSWLPLQVVARNLVNNKEFACMNPAPVVDVVKGTGKIIVVFNKMETSEWAITKGKGIARVFSIASYDHGQTWDEEQDITLQVHKPFNPGYVDVYKDAALPENKEADWRKQVPTLGHAIQLQGTAENPITRGRLFFIGCRTQGDESVFYTQNYAFWSDDLGKSWQIGDVITTREDGSSAKGLNEATAVELADGSVMVNSRNYQNGRVVGFRAITIGKFDSEGELEFAKVKHDVSLLDSGVQSSLISHKNKQNSVLLFAHPDHPAVRKNMTTYLSFDEGKSWSSRVLIDPGPSAYSDLLSLNETTVGLLYEQGNHGGIVFTRFSYLKQ